MAWQSATTDFEKFIAAHYLARHQSNVNAKLEWDTTALSYAFRIDCDDIKLYYPSLYLNIGKCYEDLNQPEIALKNYQLAHSYIYHMADDGYAKMIISGIDGGIKRISGN